MIEYITFETITNISELLAKIVVGAGAIGSIWYFAKRAFYTPAKTYFTNLSTSIHQIPMINDKIKDIYKEITTNGGASLKDGVMRIDKNIFLLEQRQKAILTSNKEVSYFETDSSGQVTVVNRTFQRLTSRALEELLGFGWLNIVDEEERSKVREEWSRCIKSLEEFTDVFFIHNSHGAKLKVRMEAYPILTKDGGLSGYVGFLAEV